MTITPYQLKAQGSYVARNVDRLLKASNITPAQLAEVSGVSESTIRRIDSYRRSKSLYQPTLRTVHKLAKITGTTVDEFSKCLLTFQ